MRTIYNWLLVSLAVTGCGTTAVLEPPAAPAPLLHAEATSAPVVQTTSVDVPEAVTAPTVEAPVETTDRENAVKWMVGFMKKHAPPGRKTYYVEAQETEEEALVRYDGIANAIVDVVYNPRAKSLFGGSNGRARSTTVILALMLFESGFMKNVDFGVGKFGRGDAGKSWCLLQINVGTGRTMRWNVKEDRPVRTGDDPADIFEGYTGPELVADRTKCVGEAYKALRLSFNSCKSKQLPLDQKLRVYGSGNCEGAVKESRLRMRAAVKFWDETHKARGFTDEALLQSVAKSLGMPKEEKKVEEPKLPIPAPKREPLKPHVPEALPPIAKN